MKTLSVAIVACLFPICLHAEAPGLPEIRLDAVRMAIEDLSESYPQQYVRGEEFLTRCDRIARMPEGQPREEALRSLQREALLANPLLKFRELLLVRRKAGKTALPANWQGNESLPTKGYDNQIARLSLDRLDDPVQTVFQPEDQRFVGDLDLNFDGRRLLFSMEGDNGRWQVHEIAIDSAARQPEPQQLTLIPDDDVDNYDACYLPDGNIVFTSTATYTGVPCVRGGSHVANIYHLDVETGTVRRLTFDQDHNWNPTVLNNGRVMYLRWEYSDLPHFVARILFHMNPDGTNQSEYYGSGSYWPNSFFYARAVPDHPTRVVGIASGHHGVRRAGELILLDPALGRREADGVIQRIPGHGKPVEAVIVDRLVDASWPKFLHPHPLSSKYFLVSMSLEGGSSWALYLVDVFDNLVLLKEEKGYDLLEPTPLAPRPLPPVIPSRVDPRNTHATVYLEDIYEGDGLPGVPRGTVKSLRLLTYHFAYRGMGGQQDPLGLDGPWDIKCVLGTVPVEPDGSALFYVPANMPISFQPLDGQGRAIQLMRSWSTAMPGENVSCVGCHQRQNAGPPAKSTIAARKSPSKIAPWHGPVRGFSFAREVEPIVNRYCADCHSTEAPQIAGRPVAPPIEDAYMFLRRMVRTPTMEPDMHVLEPYEYHADTTELVRMLQTGHYGVRLDDESWDRIVTWIDLNTPRQGTWTETVGRKRMAAVAERRRDLMRRYAGIDGITENPDELSDPLDDETLVSVPKDEPPSIAAKATEPRQRIKMLELPPKGFQPAVRTIALEDGNRLELVRIPAGAFLVGNSKIEIAEPFWMTRDEISNRQYAAFDPNHDSRMEPKDWLHFDPIKRGSPLNEPEQPVAKVSWSRAVEYCDWLAEKTGLDCGLPTEEQWQWACRAGTEGPLWYGDRDTPFATYANLADMQFRANTHSKKRQWRPAIVDQDDGFRVSSPVGSFEENPWGLRDMHGNVAEWTASVFQARTDETAAKRVVLGGSWSDRPRWAEAGFRWGYFEYQKVYNVGFRVIVREASGK
ncbi:MAG: SUMF1/EgtB/PvdO family nonheme iron enzyme [Thermoguttaceae bacterium]